MQYILPASKRRLSRTNESLVNEIIVSWHFLGKVSQQVPKNLQTALELTTGPEEIKCILILRVDQSKRGRPSLHLEPYIFVGYQPDTRHRNADFSGTPKKVKVHIPAQPIHIELEFTTLSLFTQETKSYSEYDKLSDALDRARHAFLKEIVRKNLGECTIVSRGNGLSPQLLVRFEMRQLSWSIELDSSIM